MTMNIITRNVHKDIVIEFLTTYLSTNYHCRFSENNHDTNQRHYIHNVVWLYRRYRTWIYVDCNNTNLYEKIPYFVSEWETLIISYSTTYISTSFRINTMDFTNISSDEVFLFNHLRYMGVDVNCDEDGMNDFDWAISTKS